MGALLVLALDVAVVWIARPPEGSVPRHADAIVVFSDDPIRVRAAMQLAAAHRADALVVSKGTLPYLGVAASCGQQQPVVVVCPWPAPPGNTRAEARMFGDLARAQHWRSVIAVTSRDHVVRARLLLDRCFDGDIAFVGTKPYRSMGAAFVHEAGGLVDALVDRSC